MFPNHIRIAVTKQFIRYQVNVDPPISVMFRYNGLKIASSAMVEKELGHGCDFYELARMNSKWSP
jgi:hypothetical protein